MFRKIALLHLGCLVFVLLLTSASWANRQFGPPEKYTSGGWNAQAVAIADLNLDGKVDLVVANTCIGVACNGTVEGQIGVLLGNGDGTFQSRHVYGTGGAAATSIVIADVNGDGKPDLVVANLCFSQCDIGGVAILLGNGDGTFQPAVAYSSAGYHASSAFAADVNGDGRLDLLVTNVCSTGTNCGEMTGGPMGDVAVLMGNGDGTFQPAIAYSSGGGLALSVTPGDMNGDGKADLIIAHLCLDSSTCQYGAIAVLLGNGDGTFQPPIVNNSVEMLFGGLAVADVNGDGKLDVLAGQYWEVAVLLGNGDGTFQATQNYSTGGEEAQSIAVADVNGDGKLDLAAASMCERRSGPPWCVHGSVGVLLGNGDGTFGAPGIRSSYGDDATAVALSDLNHDTRPDLVVVSECANGSHCREEGSAVVFLNSSRFRTTTDLGSNLNPSGYGQAVTFTATVTSAGPTPTGRVAFKDGTKTIKTVALTGGTASLTMLNLAVGTHSITAEYGGDAANNKSTSSVLNQVVQ